MHQKTESLRRGPPTLPVTERGGPDVDTRDVMRARELLQRYGQTGSLPDLAECLEIYRAGLGATPDDDVSRSGVLHDLAAVLHAWFERTGDPAAMAEAVDASRQAVGLVAPGHPARPFYLNTLGNGLRAMFELSGDPRWAAEAVDVGREALAAVPAGHPGRSMLLNGLSGTLCRSFLRSDHLPALTEAVYLARRAVAEADPGDPHFASYLNNLGFALMILAERNADPAVLAEAADTARRVLAARPEGHPDRARSLSNLGNVLMTLYARTGEIARLHEAVEAGRLAVATIPADHASRVACLTNLGAKLQRLYERTGDLDVLREAVDVSRQAVAASPEGHPDHAGRQANLGIVLWLQFRHTGETGLLVEAAEVTRRAASAFADDDVGRASSLNSLSIVLGTLFLRSGDLSLTAESVDAARGAVAAVPQDHQARAMYSSTLAVALGTRFRWVPDAGLLSEAVDAARLAVEVIPSDHPDRASYLNNLCLVQRTAFEMSGDDAVLAEAVESARRAVAASAEGHPELAGRWGRLGVLLEWQSERTADPELGNEAVECLRAAAGVVAAPGPVRLEWLWMFAFRRCRTRAGAQEALAAMETAASLVPQISPRTLARGDRESQTAQFGPTAEVSALAALCAGRPGRAVELLEATRGTLVADVIDARGGDVARLRAALPDLAREFEELRSRRELLDRPDVLVAARPGAPVAGADLGAAIRDLARDSLAAQADWDALLARIRAVDGFAGFLAPPGIAELTGHAALGAIVFVVATPVRCDALVLTGDRSSPVRVVELDKLTHQDVAARAAFLASAPVNVHPRDLQPPDVGDVQTELLEALAWLWDTVAEPVLDALGHTAVPVAGSPWPRVWWCPVGSAASLPLHAAGHHADLVAADPAVVANPRTVLDRVVSSYTPTVRALAHARSHPPAAATAGSTLIVAVPDAPETRPLTGVRLEADVIEALIPSALRPERPGREAVLEALPTHPVAHFACHGLADPRSPVFSSLILHDYGTRPLILADITALHLTGALAYLSACATAATAPQLADEALHLTGAFHLAGYQNVIGTLWPVDDRAAERVAADFYASLTRGGRVPPDTSLCAEALHHAVRGLRADFPASPALWAAHTHTGV